MSELRFGILSTANIADTKVIPGMRKAARVRVAAIGSRDVARAREVAARHGIERVHGSYEALLADPRDRRRLHPAAQPSAPGVDHGGRPGGQARPVREAAGHDRGRGRADGRGLRTGRRAAHGGVHVPPPSLLAGRARDRRQRPHRPPAGGAELVQLLQRRPDEHPEHPGRRRWRPVRHRLLQRQPLTDALRRRARPCRGGHHPRPA